MRLAHLGVDGQVAGERHLHVGLDVGVGRAVGMAKAAAPTAKAVVVVRMGCPSFWGSVTLAITS